MSALKPSASRRSGKRHAHWDKVVSVAYLRLIGHTQAEAAIAAGRSERTIRNWEADTELWAAAREEANSRWLQATTDAARRTVLKAVARNADLAFRILERLDPELAPPKQRHEHGGEGGGPIVIEVFGAPAAAPRGDTQ
jgi:hypothetical protein